MLSNKPVQAPLKSITLEYRHEKARLVMELRNFSDEIVKDIHARVATGKDWRIWGGIQKALWWTGSKKGRQALDGVISGSGP